MAEPFKGNKKQVVSPLGKFIMEDLVDQGFLIKLGLRKTGEFTLHSGDKSKVFWDVDELLSYPFLVRLEAIKSWAMEIALLKPNILEGITEGGYSLAVDLSRMLDVLAQPAPTKALNPHWKRRVLVDDVLTTGTSIRQVMKAAEYEYSHIAVLVNRSQFKDEVFGVPLISGIFADPVGENV